MKQSIHHRQFAAALLTLIGVLTTAQSAKAQAYVRYESLGDRHTAVIKQITEANFLIHCAAFHPDGGAAYIVMSNNRTICHQYGLPDKLVKQLKDLRRRKQLVKWLSFTKDGGWLLLYNKNSYKAEGISREVLNGLRAMRRRNCSLYSVSLSPDSDDYAIVSDKTIYYQTEDAGLKAAVKEAAQSGHPVKQVSFGPDGGWAITWGSNGYRWKSAPQSLGNALELLNSNRADLHCIAIRPDNGWGVFCSVPLQNQWQVQIDNAPVAPGSSIVKRNCPLCTAGRKRCERCGGDGWLNSMSLDTTRVNCTRCYGAGKVSCWACSGTGIQTLFR